MAYYVPRKLLSVSDRLYMDALKLVLRELLIAAHRATGQYKIPS